MGGVDFCPGAVEEGWWRPGSLNGGPFSLPAVQDILQKARDRGGAVSLADLETLSAAARLTGARPPLGQWWQNRGGEGKVTCTPAGV